VTIHLLINVHLTIIFRLDHRPLAVTTLVTVTPRLLWWEVPS